MVVWCGVCKGGRVAAVSGAVCVAVAVLLLLHLGIGACLRLLWAATLLGMSLSIFVSAACCAGRSCLLLCTRVSGEGLLRDACGP